MNWQVFSCTKQGVQRSATRRESWDDLFFLFDYEDADVTRIGYDTRAPGASLSRKPRLVNKKTHRDNIAADQTTEL
jgi:hypothetical protein